MPTVDLTDEDAARARIRVAYGSRRDGPTGGTAATPYDLDADRERTLVVGDVELDIDGHLLLVANRPVPMTEQEMRLLVVLMANAGRVLRRRFLLDEAWRVGYPDHNKTLEVHVRRIRRNIDRPGAPSHIRTVRGIGYVFDRP